MKEIVDNNKSKYPDIIIDKELNKYNNSVFQSNKLKQANQIISKYGLPDEWEKETLDLKEEKSFWISGILKQADAEKNTFLVTVQAPDKPSKTHFNILTLAETLSDLVKKYWGKNLTVYIKPIDKKNKTMQYELLDVKMS